MKNRIYSRIIKASSNPTRKGLRIVRISKETHGIVNLTIRDNNRLVNILK